MKLKITLLVLALLLLSACSTSQQTMVPGASAVRVVKSDPPDNYTEIGPITVKDGSGCGGFGSRGSYENAVIMAKNKAYSMGGDFVQVFNLSEPHFRPGCFVNEYVISGSVFKKTSDKPTPLFVTSETSTAVVEKSGAEKLRELKKLLDDKIITAKEYEGQKQRILQQGL